MSKSYKEDDIFGDGFTVHNSDGSSEHFNKNLFNDGYTGSNDTHIDKHILDDGIRVTDKYGNEENFYKNLFSDGYHGSNGTSVTPHLFDSGATIYKKDDSYNDTYGSNSDYDPYYKNYDDSYNYSYNDTHSSNSDYYPYYSGYNNSYDYYKYLAYCKSFGPSEDKTTQNYKHYEKKLKLRERFKKDTLGFFIIIAAWLFFAGFIYHIVSPLFYFDGSSLNFNKYYLVNADFSKIFFQTLIAISVFQFLIYLTNSVNCFAGTVFCIIWSILLWVTVFVCMYKDKSSVSLERVFYQIFFSAFLLTAAIAFSRNIGDTVRRFIYIRKSVKEKRKSLKYGKATTVISIIISAVCAAAIFDQQYFLNIMRMYSFSPFVLIAVPILLNIVLHNSSTYLGNELDSIWYGTASVLWIHCLLLWLLSPQCKVFAAFWFLPAIFIFAIIIEKYRYNYNIMMTLSGIPLSLYLGIMVSIHSMEIVDKYYFYRVERFSALYYLAAAVYITFREIFLHMAFRKK